jgi:hypothetical protein
MSNCCPSPNAEEPGIAAELVRDVHVVHALIKLFGVGIDGEQFARLKRNRPLRLDFSDTSDRPLSYNDNTVRVTETVGGPSWTDLEPHSARPSNHQTIKP